MSITKIRIDPSFDNNALDTNNIRKRQISYIKTDDCIGSSIREGKYWEEWMFDYIKANYIEGTNMIDLGANIGTTTMLMSEVLSENCKVYSFEPIYSDILLKNIKDNNLTSKVDIYPYGIGNKVETLKIQKVDLNSIRNFGAVSIINTLQDSTDSMSMIIFPLDFFNFENVSLIKIDVEHMVIYK